VDGKIHRYISVSRFCADILEPLLPGTPKIDILFNPIDIPNSGPAPVSENRPFLFVGRFVETKGVHLFAEAISRTKLPAVFVGDGPLKAEMQKKCPEAVFTGWLASAGVRELMRESRALVFPSMWYEAQPLTPAEALANGVPVITSDCNAAVDYVIHGENGLHFANGDVDALCEKMLMLADSDTAARMGISAYEGFWKAPWSLERHTDKLVEIYEDMLAE
jgi:glycosyltransferase involved in cell wall biosynthesis